MDDWPSLDALALVSGRRLVGLRPARASGVSPRAGSGLDLQRSGITGFDRFIGDESGNLESGHTGVATPGP